MDKRVQNMADMFADCDDVRDGATVLLAGFGDAGVAVQLVDALRELALRDLTVVSNGAGGGDYGLGALIKSGCVGKMICTFPRSSNSKIFEDLYAAGEIELETVPQGTLAERLRAGGAGIPAFYTATAYGTPLAEGKEIREFDGRHYVMERGIRADIALIHAATADRWGNLTYSKTARNFNPPMAMAASTTLVEVRRFVDHIDPEVVVTPGIFVDRMIEVGEAA
ncbi:MAG: 3-oxoacid CoA-transferase subunit A [Gammaproteobacteria bacterium]